MVLAKSAHGIILRVPSVGKGSGRRPENNMAYKANYERVFNRDKLYGRRWRKARRQFLAENPLCVMCADEGRVEEATELDHIERHRGDQVKFWDVKNWQGLCAFHHRSVKSQMEKSGKVRGNRVDGSPIDPDTHWK